MEDFFSKYGVEIILSVLSILFGIFISYIFYRLQKRDAVSAQEERARRAIEELLGVLESYVINKQQLSKETIHNLLAASERSHRVVLTGVCNPISLLQDVSLGLQKSRHLDVIQKAEYAIQIDNVITNISGTEIKIPTNIRTNLNLLVSLEEAFQNNNKDLVQERISELRSSLERLETPVSTRDSTRSSLLTETLLIGLTGVLLSYLTLTDFFSLDTFEGFLALYFMVAVFISIFVLGTPQGRRFLNKVRGRIRR